MHSLGETRSGSILATLSKKQSEGQELPSLSRVFGYMAVKELSLLEDRVKLLARLGYPNREIAIICDTTPETVATLKAKPSKGHKRGRPRKK